MLVFKIEENLWINGLIVKNMNEIFKSFLEYENYMINKVDWEGCIFVFVW